jgi:hypothetical protein
MLHWLYTYVGSVCFKCFSCFKYMLQAYVCKCFIYFGRMLQVLHDQVREVGTDKGDPLGRSCLRIRTGSEAGTAPPTCMRRCMRTAASGWTAPAGEAAVALGDNNSSSSARTGAAATCRRSGRSCMHVLWDPPRQSGRQRRGARVPSVGSMHPGKCAVCAVSCHMQRERVRRVGEQ